MACRLQLINSEIRDGSEIVHAALCDFQNREVGEYVGICSLESDLRIVEPRHLRIALDMEITCAEMEQSCGRPRIVGADANRVGQDMRPDIGCSRNRIIEPVVVWSVGLSSRPISGHLQPRTQRMIDL